jgi:hypothetical protein
MENGLRYAGSDLGSGDPERGLPYPGKLQQDLHWIARLIFGEALAMTLQGTVQWGQNDIAAVDSADAFTELLRRLEAEAHGHPIMIDVIAGDGRSLALGLGRRKAVLSFAGPDGSPPYFASVGDENAGSDLSFDYHGEVTDFKSRNAVPVSSARMAATQFLSEPGLPGVVRWEQV